MNRSDRKSSPIIAIAVSFLALIVLYFVPLAIVLLDEMVFGTYYVSETLPGWCKEFFRFIYWPIMGPW